MSLLQCMYAALCFDLFCTIFMKSFVLWQGIVRVSTLSPAFSCYSWARRRPSGSWRPSVNGSSQIITTPKLSESLLTKVGLQIFLHITYLICLTLEWYVMSNRGMTYNFSMYSTIMHCVVKLLHWTFLIFCHHHHLHICKHQLDGYFSTAIR